MTLVEQWNSIEAGLDPNWGDARLVLTLADASHGERAGALLGPASPGRSGNTLRFFSARRGAGVGPEAVRRMLRRLDEEKIGGRLELVASDTAPQEPESARQAVAASWDMARTVLPTDWSDLYCELDLTSSDHLEPTALLIAPLNPMRSDGMLGFRFRCARSFGYGASPEMVGRCLARLDEEGIPGQVRILIALSDTHPAATQGPVWQLSGKTV